MGTIPPSGEEAAAGTPRPRNPKRGSPEAEKARTRRYQDRHRDEIRERDRRKRAADPEGIRRYNREYAERTTDQRRLVHRRWRAANPGRVRSNWLRNAHGMTPENWGALWQSQGGCCYLCGDPLDVLLPRFIHIDHDHSCCPDHKSCTRCRRGLACHSCNVLIGLAGDDPERLLRIAAALRSTQEAVRNRPLVVCPVQLELFPELGAIRPSGCWPPGHGCPRWMEWLSCSHASY